MDARDRLQLRALRRAAVSLDPDILGMQEVECRRWHTRFVNQAAYVARALGARQVFAPIRPPGPILRGYGNALIARGAIEQFVVRPLPGSRDRQPRVALFAQVTVRGAQLSVAVTHLQTHPRRLQHLPGEAPAQL